jgi:choline transport protein
MHMQQELKRNFRFVSIFGYSMVLMATWETADVGLFASPLNAG